MRLKYTHKLFLACLLTAALPVAVGFFEHLGEHPGGVLTRFNLTFLAVSVLAALAAAGLLTRLLGQELRQLQAAARQMAEQAARGERPQPPPGLPPEAGQLLTDVTDRLLEVAALRETGLALTAELDMPRLLRVIVEHACRLLGVSGGVVYEAELPRRKLVLRAAVGRQPDAVGTEMDFGEGLAGRVAETDAWLFVPDYQSWAGRSERFASRPSFSVLGLPLRWRGQLIGVLNLEDEVGSLRLQERGATLAGHFALQAAAALGNARLYAAANRQVERLAVMHQASQAVGHSLDLEQVYQAIYQAVGQLMPNEAFAIALLTPDGQQVDTAFLVDQGRRVDNLHLDSIQGLTRHLQQSGEPLRLGSRDEWPAGLQHFGAAESVQSVLAVPLQVGETFLGALATESYRAAAFDPDDVPLLMMLSNQAASAIQNARLFDSVQRQLNELTALHAVARAAVSASDLDDIIARAIPALHQRMGCDLLAIFLLDSEPPRLRLHPWFITRFPALAGAAEVPVGAGLAGQVALHRLSRRVADETGAPDDRPILPGMRSEVGVPLLVGERLIGVLDAAAGAPQAFSADDERLLTILAGLLAPIIENARLSARDRRRLDELSLLHEVVMTAVSATDFDSIVTQAVRLLQRRLGYEIAGVALLDETGEWLQAHPSYAGVPDSRELAPLHISQGIIGAAVQSGRPQRVDDVTQDERYREVVPGVRSELAVPLQLADRVIGVLNAESRQPAAFGEVDTQLLTVVAAVLAPIMETARLRARAEQYAQELDVLYQAQLSASAGVDPRQVLHAIVGQVGRALEMSCAYAVELVDEQLAVAADYRSPGLDPERVHVPLPRDMFKRAWQGLSAGQAVYLYPGDAALSEAEREYLRRYQGQALLLVPLTRGGRLLGHLELWESRRPRVFSGPERHLAQSLASHATVVLENSRLFRSAQRRADQMRLINEVSQAIAGILDVDELLDRVSQNLEQVFGYSYAHMGWREGNEIVFRDRFSRRRGVTIPGSRVALDGPGLLAWVARNAQSRLVADVGNDPLHLPSPYFPHTRSELAVPLVSHGKLIGVLGVQSESLGGLGADDVTALEAISGQLAVAVENARLFAEARQRADEVSGLLATTLALSSSLNLNRRLDAIARFARRLVDADSCIIYRLEAKAGRLRPLMVQDRFAEQIQGITVALGEGITGFVALTGKGELVSRVELDPRAKQVPGTPLTPESLIAVPLKVGDQITGVMAVYREGMREFNAHDFNLITSFAAQAATAIENAELYQELEERANSLQAAYDELAEMDRHKDEMVQNVSHELRTPMTFLKSYVDMLRQGHLGPLTPDQEQALQVVAEKTDALVQLVGGIFTLQVVSPETLRLESVDMALLARQAAQGVAALAQAAGLRLETEIPAEPVVVRGDGPQLAQVLDNLLGNAVKFTERGGKIQLAVHPREDHVRVEVRDTGIGISTDNLKKIFDRFYQVDGTRTRRRGGVGLGLAISRRIVESHGGEMGVASKSGQGSTFYFSLPVDALSAGGARPPG